MTRRHARTERIESPRFEPRNGTQLSDHEQALMSISEPFIRRPIATSLLMLGVLVFGIAAYGLLPVAAVPNVDFPTITVTASTPARAPRRWRRRSRPRSKAIHFNSLARPR